MKNISKLIERIINILNDQRGFIIWTELLAILSIVLIIATTAHSSAIDIIADVDKRYVEQVKSYYIQRN